MNRTSNVFYTTGADESDNSPESPERINQKHKPYQQRLTNTSAGRRTQYTSPHRVVELNTSATKDKFYESGDERKQAIAQDNVAFLQAQIRPLMEENYALKDGIIAMRKREEEEVRALSALVKETNRAGVSRTIQKNVGDAVQLRALLYEDQCEAEEALRELERQRSVLLQTVDELNARIVLMNDEKNTALQALRSQFEAAALVQQREAAEVSEKLRKCEQSLRESEERESASAQTVKELQIALSDSEKKARQSGEAAVKAANTLQKREESWAEEKKRLADRQRQLLDREKENYFTQLRKIKDEHHIKVESLKEQVREKTASLGVLEAQRGLQVSELDTQKQKLEEQCLQLRTQVQGLSSELTATLAKYNQACREKADIEIVLGDVRTQLEKERAESEKQAEILRRCRTEAEELRRRYSELEVTVRAKQAFFEEQVARMKAQHERRLEDETRQWEVRLMVSQENLQTKYETQLEEVAHRNTEYVKSLQAEITELQAQNSEVRLELLKKEREVENLEQSQEDAISRQRQQAEEEHRGERQRLEQALTVLQKRTERQEIELQEKSTLAARLRQDAKVERERLLVMRETDLEQQKRVFEESQRSLQQEARDRAAVAAERLEEVRAELREAQTRADILAALNKRAAEEALAQAEVARNELEDAHNRATDLEARLSALTSENSELATSLEEAKRVRVVESNVARAERVELEKRLQQATLQLATLEQLKTQQQHQYEEHIALIQSEGKAQTLALQNQLRERVQLLEAESEDRATRITRLLEAQLAETRKSGETALAKAQRDADDELRRVSDRFAGKIMELTARLQKIESDKRAKAPRDKATDTADLQKEDAQRHKSETVVQNLKNVVKTAATDRKVTEAQAEIGALHRAQLEQQRVLHEEQRAIERRELESLWRERLNRREREIRAEVTQEQQSHQNTRFELEQRILETGKKLVGVQEQLMHAQKMHDELQEHFREAVDEKRSEIVSQEQQAHQDAAHTIEDLTIEQKRLQKLCQSLQERIVIAEREKQELEVQLREDWKQEVATCLAKAKAELSEMTNYADSLQQSHEKFANEAQKELNEFKKLCEQRVAHALQQRDELMTHLEQRPSRADDLEAIDNLRTVIDEKEKFILSIKNQYKETHEMVRYMEMEIEHQKRIYNIFGASNNFNSNLAGFKGMPLGDRQNKLRPVRQGGGAATAAGGTQSQQSQSALDYLQNEVFKNERLQRASVRLQHPPILNRTPGMGDEVISRLQMRRTSSSGPNLQPVQEENATRNSYKINLPEEERKASLTEEASLEDGQQDYTPLPQRHTKRQLTSTGTTGALPKNENTFTRNKPSPGISKRYAQVQRQKYEQQQQQQKTANSTAQGLSTFKFQPELSFASTSFTSQQLQHLNAKSSAATGISAAPESASQDVLNSAWPVRHRHTRTRQVLGASEQLNKSFQGGDSMNSDLHGSFLSGLNSSIERQRALQNQRSLQSASAAVRQAQNNNFVQAIPTPI